MGTASQGALAKLFVATASVETTAVTDFGTGAAPAGEQYEIIGESMQQVLDILETNGIRGTRTANDDRLRDGTKVVTGTISMIPSPDELALWLPRIFLAATGQREATTDTQYVAGDSIAKTNGLPFAIAIDRVAKRDNNADATPAEQQYFMYQRCYVTRATFSAQAGGLLQMDLDIVGQSESDVATEINFTTAAPSIKDTTGVASQPFTFYDSDNPGTGSRILLPPNSLKSEVFDISITIDNVFDVRFTNSQTATSFCPVDRIVTVAVTSPWDESHDTLYQPRKTNANKVGQVVFLNTSGSFDVGLTFDFAQLQGPEAGPIVQGKQEIVQQLIYRSRAKSTDTFDVAFTVDHNELA